MKRSWFNEEQIIAIPIKSANRDGRICNMLRYHAK
jgi:hypothetical protein